jgi:acyl-CoA dehydrogenase
MTYYHEGLVWYCKDHLIPYLEVPENELKYPKQVLADLKELGVFGINIPKEFSGSGLNISDNVKLMCELGKVWLSLPALIGTHLRANMYFSICGTTDQKEKFLPRMASGEIVFSHAYHEKATKDLGKISTTLEKEGNKYLLNGSKDWVTNAKNADYFIAIARDTTNNNLPVAIIVNPKQKGVKIGSDLIRPGIKGVSLCEVTFNSVSVDPVMNIIGGKGFSVLDFIQTYKLGSALGFSGRAIGASEAVIDDCRRFIDKYKIRKVGNEIIEFRFAQMYQKYITAKNNLFFVLNNYSDLANKTPVVYLTKVACTQALQEIVSDAIMLKGGYGYASNEGFLQRMYRDCASLALIDTPNDILIYRAGNELLS